MSKFTIKNVSYTTMYIQNKKSNSSCLFLKKKIANKYQQFL